MAEALMTSPADSETIALESGLPPGLEDIQSRLQKIDLFCELTPNDLAELASNLKVIPFASGQRLVDHGESIDGLYIVLDGRIDVFVREAQLNFEKRVRRINPGEYVGEVALLSGDSRPMSLRAASIGRAVVLGRAELLNMALKSSLFSLAICQGLVRHLEKQNRQHEAIRFVDLTDAPGVARSSQLIPPRVSLLCQALVIEVDGNFIRVGMVDPHNESNRQFINEVLSQYSVEFVAISLADFERNFEMHVGPQAKYLSIDEGNIRIAFMGAGGTEQELTGDQSAQLLRTVLADAVRYGASDVHFEPIPGAGRVRQRIDGKLMPMEQSIGRRLFTTTVNRLKVMGEVDIANQRMPQDGRFVLRVGERMVEIRMSTMPCQGGEKAVLRLLDPAQRRTELRHIIYSEAVCMLVRDMFLSSSGLVLVTGPTGSGKTTTLYAGINEVWRSSQALNIVTIEDPIEYELNFATQTQVARAIGLDFPQLLRSILRQDPDVILVGEIRDQESANVACEAAGMGQLVCSSLHTDSALETVGRLRNLSVRSYQLATALRGVISQQLLPRVCRNCAEVVPPDDRHIKALRLFGILDKNFDAPVYRGRGCDRCRLTGESGRVAMFEIFSVDETVRDLIDREVYYKDMAAALTPETYISMASYARYLLREGLVSPERVREFYPAKGLQGDIAAEMAETFTELG